MHSQYISLTNLVKLAAFSFVFFDSPVFALIGEKNLSGSLSPNASKSSGTATMKTREQIKIDKLTTQIDADATPALKADLNTLTIEMNPGQKTTVLNILICVPIVRRQAFAKITNSLTTQMDANQKIDVITLLFRLQETAYTAFAEVANSLTTEMNPDQKLEVIKSLSSVPVSNYGVFEENVNILAKEINMDQKVQVIYVLSNFPASAYTVLKDALNGLATRITADQRVKLIKTLACVPVADLSRMNAKFFDGHFEVFINHFSSDELAEIISKLLEAETGERRRELINEAVQLATGR